MSEAFERDTIDRLARIETTIQRLFNIEKRLDNLEKNHSRGSVAGGSIVAVIMAGIAVVLKMLGWL